jgi:hypothetical protein
MLIVSMHVVYCSVPLPLVKDVTKMIRSIPAISHTPGRILVGDGKVHTIPGGHDPIFL